MFTVNTTSKKFTESASLDLGLLPVDGKIDIRLTDGSEPVIAEGKTFTMTVGTIEGTLYKTDEDTVSFRYLQFDDSNVASSLPIVISMDGVEILNDTISLTYQEVGGGDPFPQGGLVGDFLQKTENGQTWAEVPAGEDTNDYLCFTATQANSTVRISTHNAVDPINLEYSLDKVNWSNYTWTDSVGETITLSNIGDCVWWRGNNSTFSKDYNKYYYFVMSGKINAYGNVASLVDKSCSIKSTTDHMFCNLFNSCSSLITAPKIPFVKLSTGCFRGMFYNCTSLVVAPELPFVTTLISSCYYEMFKGCTSLVDAPFIPSFGGTAYHMQCGYMFRGCTSLKHVKVGFTSWNSVSTDWFQNVSATGVFECPSALDCSTRDASHVPAGWTIVRTDSPKSITSPTSASSEATYEVSPDKADVPVVTVASALTLSATAIDSGSVAYAEVVLDIASGATVTAGSNLTLVDTPTAGKRNVCVCRWSNGVCKLYVTIVDDLPTA